jgi:hypothetical protein
VDIDMENLNINRSDISVVTNPWETYGVTVYHVVGACVLHKGMYKISSNGNEAAEDFIIKIISGFNRDNVMLSRDTEVAYLMSWFEDVSFSDVVKLGDEYIAAITTKEITFRDFDVANIYLQICAAYRA